MVTARVGGLRRATFARWVGAMASCLLLQGMAPAAALAGDAPGASAQGDLPQQAQKLFEAGLDAIKKKDFSGARTFLLSAWRIRRHWLVALHLGHVEKILDKPRDAAEHLSFGLREAPRDKLDPLDRTRGEAMLAEAKSKVGAVRLSVTPATAEVLVDGVSLGQAEGGSQGQILFVEPGTRRIEARAPGYAPIESILLAKPSKELSVELRLVAVQGPKDTGPAVVEAKGANKAVVIAGASAAATPAALGIGLVVGSFAEASARDRMSLKGCIEDDRYSCERNRTEGRSVDLASASLGAFIAAGVLGAATLTYVLVARKPASAAAPKASLWVGPGAGGVLVTGRW